ncbi:hypothetical protein GCM10027160_28920 [Streptomyces calidiresistens]|uniref:Uncharacterized protein n=1 Tax=Streptomyces calidiresistens TaxID=1485586 RepID=A0A7W3T0A0_9ACTN|nr:hypothetical protein [Streptomyces calidiresistens]MBB0228511.1 hypothetical protein [Streptomyces calidiresistens]
MDSRWRDATLAALLEEVQRLGYLVGAAWLTGKGQPNPVPEPAPVPRPWELNQQQTTETEEGRGGDVE